MLRADSRPFAAALLLLAVGGGGAAEALEIRGTVLDPSRVPLAGARIELSPVSTRYVEGMRFASGRPAPPPPAVAESGDDGRFRLEAPAVGIWRVAVRAPGFAAMERAPLAVVEPLELAPVVLHRGSRIRVRVRSPAGEPLTGVLVTAVGSGARRPAGSAGGWRPVPGIGRTDRRGEVEIAKRAGERLEVAAFGPPGLASARGTGVEAVTLTLADAGWGLIEVRDGAGSLLAGVLARSAAGGVPVGSTGADGRLRVPRHGPDVELRLSTADDRHAVARLGPDTAPRRLVQPPPRWLEGTVLERSTRRPLAGALVWTGADPGTARRTDDRGSYRLPVPAARRFWVQAEAPGYLPRSALVEPDADLRVPTLALPRSGEVRGRVVDAGDRPLPGVTVAAVPSHPGRRSFYRSDVADGRVTTDAEGRFTIGGLSPGDRYDLRTGGRGLLPATVQAGVPAPGRRAPPIEIALTVSRPIAGRVVDEGGRPLADAEVEARPADGSAVRAFGEAGPGENPFRAAADAAGRFRLAAPPSAEFDLGVRRQGYATLLLRRVEVPAGAGAFDLGRLVLTPAASVAGVVVDASGDAVEGAAVHLLEVAHPPADVAGERLARGEPEAVTGVEGRFRLDGLTPGRPVSLVVTRAGFAPAVLGALEPTVPELEVVLAAGLALRGRVTDAAGDPVGGAVVDLVWSDVLRDVEVRRKVGLPVARSVRSNADGVYAFDGLRPGAVSLGARAAGLAPSPIEEIELAAGSGPPEIDFVLRTGAVVEGRVETRDGEPIPGARVIAGRTAGESDAEGFYRIAGVIPGRVRFEVRHPGYEWRREAVEIGAGVNAVDWIFEDGPPVAGRVVDPAGLPVADADVALRLEPYGTTRYSARSGGDGTFRLRQVAAGHYRAAAGKPGFALAELERPVVVGSDPVEDLELVLAPGAVVRGRVTGLELEQMGRLRVVAADGRDRERAGRVDHRGRYEIVDLGAGRWRIAASLDGGRRHAQAVVMLAPGGREVRDLDFGDRASFSGEVVYRGEPLAGTLVALRGLHRAVEREGRADYAGRFRFETLEPGTYHLELVHDRMRAIHNETLRIEGDHRAVFELGSSRVSGWVVDAAGRPLPGVLLSLRRVVEREGEEENLTTTGTDAEGFFELPRVPPGLYRFGARKDGFGQWVDELRVPAAGDLLGLEIALTPSRGLDLVVRLASGGVPERVDLQVLDGEGRAIVRESRRLSDDGRARIKTVPAGGWRVLVAAPGGAPVEIRAEVPGAPVAVVLPDASRLEIEVPALALSDLIATAQLVDASGRPFRGLSPGGGLADRWPLSGGRGAVEGVPPGLWEVRISAPDGALWSRPLTVAGAVVKVRLE